MTRSYNLRKYPTIEQSLNAPIKIDDGFPENKHFIEQRLKMQEEDRTAVNFMKLMDEMTEKRMKH